MTQVILWAFQSLPICWIRCQSKSVLRTVRSRKWSRVKSSRKLYKRVVPLSISGRPILSFVSKLTTTALLQLLNEQSRPWACRFSQLTFGWWPSMLRWATFIWLNVISTATWPSKPQLTTMNPSFISKSGLVKLTVYRYLEVLQNFYPNIIDELKRTD